MYNHDKHVQDSRYKINEKLIHFFKSKFKSKTTIVYIIILHFKIRLTDRR